MAGRRLPKQGNKPTEGCAVAVKGQERSATTGHVHVCICKCAQEKGKTGPLFSSFLFLSLFSAGLFGACWLVGRYGLPPWALGAAAHSHFMFMVVLTAGIATKNDALKELPPVRLCHAGPHPGPPSPFGSHFLHLVPSPSSLTHSASPTYLLQPPFLPCLLSSPPTEISSTYFSQSTK